MCIRDSVEGGHMDIPEIDPDEIKHLSPDGRARMTDEELEEHIHKLCLLYTSPAREHRRRRA